LFSDLFAGAEEFLSPRPSDLEFEEARNNPENARAEPVNVNETTRC